MNPVLHTFGSGPPLVFVHGFPLDHRMWKGQLSLADRRRLLLLDLGGFGGSPAPPPPPSIGAYADEVLRGMDLAGLDQAPLCGLSMGGYVLFELWRRARSRISALILCDTRAEADSPEARKARQANMELVRDGRQRDVVDGMLSRLLGAVSLSDPTLVAEVRAMMATMTRAGLLYALEALKDRPDSVGTLGDIEVPVLLVVGVEDAITPPDASESMQRGVPGSRLASIPGAGHLSPLENPGAFNAALLSFLEDFGL